MKRQYREACCTKDKARALNTDMSRLGFLFTQISMPTTCMSALIRVPEFVDKVNDLVDKGIKVKNKDILEIGTRIIAQRLPNKINGQQINPRAMRRGLNHIRRALSQEDQSNS